MILIEAQIGSKFCIRWQWAIPRGGCERVTMSH